MLLHQNIRKQINAQHINKEGIKHAREVNVIDRIQINGTGSSFITLKDPKENFLNRLTTSLLNHARNEIGRITKHMLQNINKILYEETKVNEWKNTESVINCVITVAPETRDKKICQSHINMR